MRVDADRDGTVDTTDPPTMWTWGASGRGAVIMANFDNDPAGIDVDTADRTIDAGNDASADIAPLVIEPVPTQEGTGGHTTRAQRIAVRRHSDLRRRHCGVNGDRRPNRWRNPSLSHLADGAIAAWHGGGAVWE